MSASTKRKRMDVMKLMMSDYNVELADDEGTDFFVEFQGPKDTAYEGGTWRVHVCLPAQYPYRSPSIGFKNRIYHPNVDFRSGTICLDVINQTWSPMYDLVNIFEVFLPQLLSYPNPADPLNNEAAALLLEDPQKYHEKVKELVIIHAAKTDDSRVEKECTTSTASKADGANNDASSPANSSLPACNSPEGITSNPNDENTERRNSSASQASSHSSDNSAQEISSCENDYQVDGVGSQMSDGELQDEDFDLDI